MISPYSNRVDQFMSELIQTRSKYFESNPLKQVDKLYPNRSSGEIDPVGLLG
jgi:hypothetical protein